MPRPSKFAPEYRESAVAMVRETGKPIAQIARDLGINEGTVGNWVNRDRRRRGEQRDDQVSETERAELVRLCREVAQLRMEKAVSDARATSSAVSANLCSIAKSHAWTLPTTLQLPWSARSELWPDW